MGKNGEKLDKNGERLSKNKENLGTIGQEKINYILGGYTDHARTTSLAAVYNGFGWTEIGNLLAPRSEHRSIVINNSIIHVGGRDLQLVSKKFFSDLKKIYLGILKNGNLIKTTLHENSSMENCTFTICIRNRLLYRATTVNKKTSKFIIIFLYYIVPAISLLISDMV